VESNSPICGFVSISADVGSRKWQVSPYIMCVWMLFPKPFLAQMLSFIYHSIAKILFYTGKLFVNVWKRERCRKSALKMLRALLEIPPALSRVCFHVSHVELLSQATTFLLGLVTSLFNEEHRSSYIRFAIARHEAFFLICIRKMMRNLNSM
jgi:hypothetical protein